VAAVVTGYKEEANQRWRRRRKRREIRSKKELDRIREEVMAVDESTIIWN
jgi:hypothetical protein